MEELIVIRIKMARIISLLKNVELAHLYPTGTIADMESDQMPPIKDQQSVGQLQTHPK